LNIPSTGQLFMDSDGSLKKLRIVDGELIIEEPNSKKAE
jgi:hypothetical protein